MYPEMDLSAGRTGGGIGEDLTHGLTCVISRDEHRVTADRLAQVIGPEGDEFFFAELVGPHVPRQHAP